MNNDIFIFIGPTIAVDEAQQHLNATYLPPVKYGDVYRITELYQPRIIGIVDGYFNQVPAVWHKEILWAINQGITVYGASSMGALRAAELEPLGMTGCGKIFQAYRQGVLPPYIDEAFEDDDEVAVVHGPAELGYKQASEAMVNIRVTLAKAQQQNLINAIDLKILCKATKNLFYPERHYSNVIELGHEHGINEEKLAKLAAWIDGHKIDQKQLDAIKMLNQISTQLNSDSPTSATKTPIFEHTSQWQTAICEIEESHAYDDPVLNEILLSGEYYFELLDQALSATFINDKHRNPDDKVNLSSLHHLPDQLDQTIKEHWQLRDSQITVENLSSSQCNKLLVDYLEEHGKLAAFSQRAEDKKNKLNQINNKPQSHQLSEFDLLQLSDWYFTQQLGIDLPDKLEDYVAQFGFNDLDHFYDIILEEYHYIQNN